MYINTNGQAYPCVGYHPGAEQVTFDLKEAAPAQLGDTVELCQDDGFVLATHTVADYARYEAVGKRLTLTNRPVPEPMPDPAPDLEEVRQGKMEELSAACREIIVAGCDVTLSDGTTGHYTLEETDQINLTAALAAVQDGADGYPYHADGQLCRLYPAVDILAVAQAATAHKLYQTTYCNHLMAWVRRAETVEELEGIIYGVELPADLKAHMEGVLGNA